LVLQISLGKVILILGIVAATLVYMGINTGFFFQEANATHGYEPGTSTGSYCGKTCQEKRDKAEIEAREKEKEDRELENPTEENKKKTSKCYGIYCDREDEDDGDSESEANKLKALIKKIGEKNFISIRVSESCKGVTYCPTIKELADQYDNSDRYYSGEFYFDNSTNEWKRHYPIIKNVFELYKLRNGFSWMVFVDPDDYTWKNTKQITIHPHYSNTKSGDKIVDNVRIEYKNLDYEPCAYAHIGWMDKAESRIHGDEILLDVLNHFMSSCRESIEYNPRIEIFINSTIWPDCDRECFELKRLDKQEMKAFHQTEKEFYEHYADLDEEEDKKEQNCYGIYCDREDEDDDEDIEIPEDRPQTFEEKAAEAELKEQRREQRIRELEEIQLCERIKRLDEPGNIRNLDCNDKEDREEYLQDKIEDDTIEDIDPDIIECQKFKAYELRTDDRGKVERASIVTCLDKYERDEYRQYTDAVYPNGLPE